MAANSIIRPGSGKGGQRDKRHHGGGASVSEPGNDMEDANDSGAEHAKPLPSAGGSSGPAMFSGTIPALRADLVAGVDESFARMPPSSRACLRSMIVASR